MDFERTVERTIRETGLLRPGDGVVVGFSGGPDSTALLHALHRLAPRWDWKVIAAHVDHGLRGEESAREADLAEAFARGLGATFERVRLDVKAVAAESGENAQAAARRLRYAFLRETAEKYGAAKIALAHHADDQAETLVMRFVRGTGPSGLAGIPIRRPEGKFEVVRPLLGLTKAELIDYCKACGLPFSEDSSNRDPKYARNRYRLEVLPFLREFNPRLTDALVRLADLMREEDAYLDAQARAAAEGRVRLADGRAAFSREWFRTLPFALQRRVIKLILNYLSAQETDLDYVHAETIRETVLREAPPNVRMGVKGGIRLIREYDDVTLDRVIRPNADRTPGEYFHSLDVSADGELDLPGGRLAWKRLPRREAGELPPGTRDEAILDLSRLFLPICVRAWKPGDRMNVLGMEGAKRVQDLFVDDKISASRRRTLPIVTDGNGEILWIPGVRRSSHALVSAATCWVLYMKYSG